MPSQFIDLNAPSLQGKQPKTPKDLPHGVIKPPELVLEIVAKEKAKFSPKVFVPEGERRLISDLTLQYYFDYLGYEVLYRETPEGPEVLAVGFEEVMAYTKNMPLEVRLKLKTWVP